MYADIKSCVSVNNEFSQFFKINCGVRQGENLSPILFSIYLNDLASYLQTGNDGIKIENPSLEFDTYLQLFVLLYADDTIIVSDNPKSFQNLLNKFNTYCNLWKLKINMSKTKVMIFGTNKPNSYKFTINDITIENVKEYKYFGTVFTSTGSFLGTRKFLYEQACKAMHILYTRIYNIDLPVDLQLKLFDQTIVPILLYNCEAWGFENLDLIEKIHTSFLRKITKSKKSTPLYMLYGELGRYSLNIVVKTRIIKYWTKLVISKESKLAHICYKNMVNSNINFKWLSFVKKYLERNREYLRMGQSK